MTSHLRGKANSSGECEARQLLRNAHFPSLLVSGSRVFWRPMKNVPNQAPEFRCSTKSWPRLGSARVPSWQVTSAGGPFKWWILAGDLPQTGWVMALDDGLG
ncbi:hypothetical protein BJY04DRAFT_58729 [Aspergillus karnatakaensis]|uniref:uncharacterized protein n=1 Tax=Aspergillus karnatakaensis TaxID=1810916 RepID=UPI003CCE0498